MTMEEIKIHANQYSQSYKRGYGPWVDNFDAMARKTVTKLNINKNGPMNTELQRAIDTDQAVFDGDKPIYIDNDKLEDEKATDEQRQAIIAANSDDIVPVTDEQLDNIGTIFADTKKSQTTTEGEGKKAK